MRQALTSSPPFLLTGIYHYVMITCGSIYMRHFWICSALVLLSCPSAYTQQRSASSFVAPDRGKEDANEAPVKVRATFMAAERTPVTDWRANEIIVRESESQARVESIACGVDELLTIGILLQINGRD